MYQIYQMAENVCVWLGSHQENTGIGIDVTRQLASSTTKTSGMDTYYQAFMHGDQALQDATWAGFNQLYESPWFFRCWVMQEVLAKPHPIAFMGDSEFDWSILPLAQLAMYAHQPILMQYVTNPHKIMLSDCGGECCLVIAFRFGRGPNTSVLDLLGELGMGKLLRR